MTSINIVKDNLITSVPKELRKFLVKNNAFDSYIHNSKEQNNFFNGIPNFFIIPKEDWISFGMRNQGGFLWSHTSEGDPFWQKLHDKWSRRCKWR